MAEILIENVSKSYISKDGSVQALKNVNLAIESGDIFGIIGMSGAGKSTLVRCMNFLEVPTEGTVSIRGKALSDLSEKELRKEREKIGMIFQHFNLLMQKSVLENICFPLYIQGKRKGEARKRAMELLRIVGLEDKAKAYPAQLSGGQKQRVAIARALASDPKILLCDEATSALDVSVQAQIVELLKEMQEKMNISYLFITHDLALVSSFCDRVAVMKNGKVVEVGDAKEVINNPMDEYTKLLIKSAYF